MSSPSRWPWWWWSFQGWIKLPLKRIEMPWKQGDVFIHKFQLFWDEQQVNPILTHSHFEGRVSAGFVRVCKAVIQAATIWVWQFCARENLKNLKRVNLKIARTGKHSGTAWAVPWARSMVPSQGWRGTHLKEEWKFPPPLNFHERPADQATVNVNCGN